MTPLRILHLATAGIGSCVCGSYLENWRNNSFTINAEPQDIETPKQCGPSTRSHSDYRFPTAYPSTSKRIKTTAPSTPSSYGTADKVRNWRAESLDETPTRRPYRSHPQDDFSDTSTIRTPSNRYKDVAGASTPNWRSSASKMSHSGKSSGSCIHQPAGVLQTALEQEELSGRKMFHLDDYLVCYDQRLQIPSWTLEQITKENITCRCVECVGFCSDPLIYWLFSPKEKYLKLENFSKICLCALRFHSNKQDKICRLYNVVLLADNVKPLWDQLNDYVEYLVQKNEVVYVCTGTLMLPSNEERKNIVSYNVIKESNVAVPTHLFKVIVTKDIEADPCTPFRVESYKIENSNESNIELDIRKYNIPLHVLNDEAGMFFFPKIPKTEIGFCETDSKFFCCC